jgi:arylsulfatase A-like enzyme
MERRTFLGSALAAAAPAALPNVLFIMPDQWRGMDLGCMGNSQVKTPNLDRLAAEGVLFTNAVANEPVCCPARAVLLTGRYPQSCGVAVNDVPLPANQLTISQILHERGYYTAFIGKWHLEGGKRLPGFVRPGSRRFGFEFWAANICDHRCFNTHYFRDDPKPLAIKGYDSIAFTDLAIGAMENAVKQRRPFFVSLQQTPPHNPYLIPPGYEGVYDPRKLQPRKNWKPGAKMLGRMDDLAGYYAAISFLDGEVGRLVKRLEELGQRDRTIVYFLSDHGDMLGSHGTFLKRKPWDESVRVPGIMRWPDGFAGGRKLDAPFSHVDAVPTLLGLAGVKPPAVMQGHDYSGYISGRTNETPEMAFIGNHSKTEAGEFDAWRGVRTRRYTYARFKQQPWVLYDNQQDPFQMKNLVEDSGQSGRIAEFDRAIQEYMRRTGDIWDELMDAPHL